MKTILVSGASGIVGYGVLRSLQMSRKQLTLVGTTIYDDSVAPGFCDIFEQAPPTSSPVYLEWLLKVIRRYQVDLVVPGIEMDMYKWVEHIPEIKASGAIPLLNNVELIHLCKDKWVFYEILRGAGMPCAIESLLSGEFDELKRKFGLPFLLKPRRGFGSKGIVRVDTEEHFLRYRQDFGPVLMAQPIVGNDDEEFTTSAFCNGRGGFYACMTLRRKLSRDGFTEKADVVSSEEFVETIAKLCGKFHPVGPTNFQFRKCTDGIKLLEINPRISSSTSIRAAFGYNESAMSVDYYLEHQMPIQPDIRQGRAVRYTEDYIFYEDSIYI
ncbi:ATP-grasp domain-containing protein [Polynucleobacter asymbioticus]|uniref:ATP-grasp domain-containing protein n=1 Tax=Polynucleobacter asymbioticus TaxID=576611 RepID=UPI0008F808E0|nr:ATP-grasp domain-containing protein [Polynucleobacter asymbioticus]